MRDEDDVMLLSRRSGGVQHGPPDLIRPDSRKHAMATEPFRKVGDCAVVLLDVRGDGRYPHQPEQHVEIEALLLRTRHGGGDRAAPFTGSAEGGGLGRFKHDIAVFDAEAFALKLDATGGRLELAELRDLLAVEDEYGRIALADDLRLVPFPDRVFVRRKRLRLEVLPIEVNIAPAHTATVLQFDLRAVRIPVLRGLALRCGIDIALAREMRCVGTVRPVAYDDQVA